MRTLHTILCFAIPLCVWVLIIRWSTQKVIQQIPKHDMNLEVKKFEIRDFDADGFRKSLGIPAE